MKTSTIALGFMLAGLLALASLRVQNDRDAWILVRSELPLEAGQSLSRSFTSRLDGYVEIQVEVESSIAAELRDRHILPTNAPSALDIHWQAAHGDRVSAAGDARDYLYVRPVPSLPGRLRRIVMQIPFERDDVHWRSMGLAGSRTIARGIGRFEVDAGGDYTVTVSSLADHRELESARPQFVVRVERRRWQPHYERLRILGYGGLALVAAGFSILLVGRLRTGTTA